MAASLHPAAKRWWAGKDEALVKEATRSGLGKGLLVASKRKELLVLTADLLDSTGLAPFKQQHPEKVLDIGVAEQGLAGLSAGLASEGYSVVMTSFAVFSPGRNWDFIRTQIAMAKLPVIIVGSHAGLATGPDGATHQALEDVALMRPLPNMTVLSPLDSVEAERLTVKALALKKPVYVRLVREKTPVLTTARTPLSIGKALELCAGADLTIMTTGTLAYEALAAAKTLWRKHKLSASVQHHCSLKPLDGKAVKDAARKRLIITVEDHQTVGGLGSAVAETIAGLKAHAPLIRLGVQDQYGESGTTKELYKAYGLDAEAIVKAALRALKK